MYNKTKKDDGHEAEDIEDEEHPSGPEGAKKAADDIAKSFGAGGISYTDDEGDEE
jgi:hypothetical protein